MSTTLIGRPVARIDGRAKVTGQARYAADFNPERQAFAVVVSATAGLGRITAIESAEVERLPGIIAVISHRNAQRLPYRPHKGGIDPAVGERLHVLQDDQIRFYGQPIAIIVAETLDQAERGALALRVSYAAEKPVVDQTDPAAVAIVPKGGGRLSPDTARGNADEALKTAAFKIDARYDTARENHNPMEPHATVAHWDGDRLTLWSKSQWVVNEQAEIAAVFGLDPGNVQVISPYVGGGFGTSLRTWPHVTLAALAARHVARPVKLVLTRKQMFYSTGHRPRSLQRIALGADTSGKLTSIIQEGEGETSRYEQFTEALTAATDFMYSCPNVRTSYRLVPLDTGTPNHMRGPGEAQGMFALETALDELSYSLKLDPIELRRRNEPSIDEGENKPFSSRSLLQCYERGAARFGWDRRAATPGTMREGRELIGFGVASATYPVFYNATGARARLLANGIAEVEVAASDMGPGTYTSITQVAAETLGLPLNRVHFKLGRSDYPPAPPHGGSQTMASVGSAVQAACRALQQKLAETAAADRASPLFQVAATEIEWTAGRLSRRGQQAGEDFHEIVRRAGAPIAAEASVRRAAEIAERFSMHSFGAVFVEVGVDPDVGIIRVRRALGVYGAGRIVNPHLARSQCTGGMVGGIGMALMERTALDVRDGRPVNAHMADYLLPVNLDIPRLDVEFVDEVDPHVNPLGVKGLGEIALVGMAPAIGNAIFHATGIRVRNLPIRIEDVLHG